MEPGKNQRGQAILESALIMMVFLPLLAGVMDLGQFLYFHQSLSERVRAAARYGAAHPFTDGSDIVNVAIYNDPAGCPNGAGAVLPYLTATAGQNGAVTAELADAGTDDARITVTITNYPYSFLLLPGGFNHRTVTDTEPYEIGR
jgi:Flp pilus assembly protein TadG